MFFVCFLERNRSALDIQESIDDIKSIEEPLLMFVRAEMANEFQKVALRGNFFRNPDMIAMNLKELENLERKEK